MTEKIKIVVSLGCGYDALPFKFLSKERNICHDVYFVDVDYPSLIQKKCDTIFQNHELGDLLERKFKPETPEMVILRSDQYMAIGCDLRNSEELITVLKKEYSPDKHTFLFLAEVSMTYMDLEAADMLVATASTFPDVRFCLLEQFLPGGAEHPFAQTMIQHFKNIRTPLKSIHRYPSCADQERRFLDAKWSSANARSLWNLWCDPKFLAPHERSALNSIEPFDEWEEFALFASHYFLLIASNTPRATKGQGLPNHIHNNETSLLGTPLKVCSPGYKVEFLINPVEEVMKAARSAVRSKSRRYAAVFDIKNSVFGHYGGQGTHESRLKTSDIYISNKEDDDLLGSYSPPAVARTCHTMTTFEDSCDCLLIGGRTSPDHALPDCWLFRDEAWERVESLPKPLYRHCSVALTMNDGLNDGVLVYGGRSTNGTISNEWLLWREDTGWMSVICNGASLIPRFGAIMASIKPGSKSGILLGGMSADGSVLVESWQWTLQLDSHFPVIDVRKASIESPLFICRFGAKITPLPSKEPSQEPSRFIISGGISQDGIITADYDVCRLDYDEEHSSSSVVPFCISYGGSIYRPLLMGHSALWVNRSLVILGGGSLCFSFGTYLNENIKILLKGDRAPPDIWQVYSEEDLLQDMERLTERPRLSSNSHIKYSREITKSVFRTPLYSNHTFEKFVNNSRPGLFEGLNLGSCSQLWTTEYLKRCVGHDQMVVVHRCTSPHMSFQPKNFEYVSVTFGEFIDRVARGEHEYLRSLASESPTDQPADFATDFPQVANDFHLPPELKLAKKKMHSSVLRISGPVTMWLHYDVMANVLCQIRGTKKILLFSPSDIMHLGIPPGESSSSINVFDPESPKLGRIHGQEAILGPGDVLFIPPFWAHTARPTDGISVAINVFFRSLEAGYSTGRDIYGNRDLHAYEEGRKSLLKVMKRFDGLPPEASRFYLERLASELKVKAMSFRVREDDEDDGGLATRSLPER